MTRTVAEVASAIVAVIEAQSDVWVARPEGIWVEESTLAQVESLLQEWKDSLTAPPLPVRIAAGEASRNIEVPATEPAARIGAQSDRSDVKQVLEAAATLARGFPESIPCAQCGEVKASVYHLTIDECWATQPICREPEAHHEFRPSVIV